MQAPITTAADNIHKYLFHCFSEKIRLDISSESSARQRIHMKNQALFSSKEKSKKIKMPSAEFLFGTFKVNILKCQPQGLVAKFLLFIIFHILYDYTIHNKKNDE